MNMSHAALAITSLVLSAGTVLGGPSEGAYPDAIASQDEIFLQEIAGRMFLQLPHEHQVKIAQAGGIGSGAVSDTVLEFDNDAPALPDVDPGITAHAYLDLIVSDALASRLSGEQWNILNTIADTLDEGKTVPHMCFAPDTDREYAYAINQLIEFPFQVRFQQTGRWTATATNGGGLGQGTPTTLTYSFVPDGTFVPDLGIGLGSGNSALFAWLDGIYGNTATWQALFAQIFDRWSQLINVTYVFEPNDDMSDTNSAAGQLGIRGDIRIAAFNYANDGNGGVLAYNNFPNDGDMVFDAFDTFYNNTGGQSLRFRNVAAHEHGHGLGMLHVCPANQTKLMEPFISVAYDGPQLDDTLNGIRHYGDIFEPNDNLAQATDLGTFTLGQVESIENIGVDDNSDDDYFRVEVGEAARITFAIAPDADSYTQGPQTSQCNTGTLTDYNAVQNLQVRVLDSVGTLLASVNDTGFGENEIMVFDTEVAGEFYFVVDGVTNVNNVQRYLVSVVVTDIPFLIPRIEADVPETIDPGVSTSIDLTINPRQDVLVPGTAELRLSINGGAFDAMPLVSNGGNSFTAVLPETNCDDSVLFYIAVEGETSGLVTLPEEGESAPFRALVGDILVEFNDDFEADLGWTITGVLGRNNGRWDRGIPNGDGSRGDAPVDADGSGSAYVTGNGNPGSDTDVDDGQTVLTSPVFDLSDNPEAIVSYSRWYDNTGSGTGAAPGEDIFSVEISNDAGIIWTTLEIVGPSSDESIGGWFMASYRVADFIAPNDSVMVRFIAEDAGADSVVEAAVDAFRISRLECSDAGVCEADLTGDGMLDFFDVSLFLSAFSANDPIADFNLDQMFDFFDVSLFLTAFNAGCP